MADRDQMISLSASARFGVELPRGSKELRSAADDAEKAANARMDQHSGIGLTIAALLRVIADLTERIETLETNHG